MNNKSVWLNKNNLNVRNLFFFGLVGLFCYLLNDSSAVAFPLFALMDCDSGGSDCDSDGGGGDSDGGGGTSSTPFLYTWQKGVFSIENDFLFGKPTSLFKNKSTGQNAYENGRVTGDLYKIQNLFELRNGRIAFQIKEIEPEESYIDHVALTRFVYNEDEELIVNSNLTTAHIFKRTDLCEQTGINNVQIFLNKKEITQELGNAQMIFAGDAQGGCAIEPQKDIIELTGIASDRDKDVFLIIKSFYRDWTLGDIFTDTEENKQFSVKEIFSQVTSVGSFAKAIMFIGTISLVSLSGILSTLFKSSQDGVTINSTEALAELFKLQKAHADVPIRSIVSEYWNGSSYVKFDVLSPRYYQMSLNAVQVPKVAVQENGEINIRITTTYKHKIGYLGLAVSGTESSAKTESLRLTKAFHHREERDYANIISKKQSGEYLHTIPADVVDVEFEGPRLEKGSHESESYVLASNGFYTNLSNDAKQRAGNWIEKLDNESRQWLASMSEIRKEN